MKKIFTSLLTLALLASANCAWAQDDGDTGGGAIADGTYYLYDKEAGVFLSRGCAWGTEASADKYGIPLNVSLADGTYTFKPYDDSGKYVNGSGGVYTDQNEFNWIISPSSKGYVISTTDNKFMTHALGNLGEYITLADDASSATIWSFLSKEERDKIVGAYESANNAQVAEQAGLTAETFEETLAGYASSVVKTIAPTEYTWTKVRGGDANNENPREVYQGTGNFTYTATGLAKGVYKVSINALERDGWNGNNVTYANAGYYVTTSYLQANGHQVRIKGWAEDRAGDGNPNNPSEAKTLFDADKYKSEVYVYVGEEGTLDLTVAVPSYLDGHWFIMGNTVITSYKGSVSEEDVEALITTATQYADSVMNVDAKTKMTDAATALSANKTSMELYQALSDAVTAAKASVSAYTAAKAELDKRAAMIESLNTNLYTAAAFDTYLTTPLAKYENLTLTTEEAQALPENSGWHQAAQFNLFLGSAFGVNSYDDIPYVNTWSDEGEKDGSGFNVPFFEYWTGNANSLGERTLTATMTDVAPGEYNVSSWVRVRVKDGNTVAPYGITMVANDGDPINVSEGTQVGTSQMYHDTYTTVATVGKDGILTIQYVVAADNNISWLSFKDVNFEVVPVTAKTDTLTYSFESTVGSCYEGYSTDVDMATILKELGATSVDELNIYAVMGDGTRDSNYGLGTTSEANIDGWRNAEGNWQAWGNDARYFSKVDFSLASGQIKEVGGMMGFNTEPVSYQAVYALANKTEGAGEYDTVYVVVELNYVAAPEVVADIVKTIDVAVTDKPGTAYSGLTATFDVDEVAKALGVEEVSYDYVSVYVVKSDGSLVENTTDGWRDIDGNPRAWGNDSTAYCIKLADPSTGTFDYLAAYSTNFAEGDTFVGRWAIVSDEDNKGVILKVTVTFTDATAIDAIEAGKAGAEGIYNIAGQKLSVLQKGLNILDGKKVFVK